MITSKFNILGKYLKQKRVQRGLCQKDVSDAAGYSSPQFISNVERGLCSPSIPALKAMMKLYGIPVSELLRIMMEDHKVKLKKQLLSSPGRNRR